MRKEKWKNFIDKLGYSTSQNRKRVGGILLSVTIFLFLVFTIRLIYIVAVGKIGNISLNEKTQQLYQGSRVVKAKRGTIYDRNGDPIAEDATSYSLYAELDKDYKGIGNVELFVHEKDKAKIAKILHKHLGLDKAEVLERLKLKKNAEGNDITHIEFGAEGKNITLEKMTAIEMELQQKKITGIYFVPHSSRSYPNGVFSPYIIGYAQFADREDESKGLSGQMGIEAAYDKELSGEDGEEIFQKDKNGNPLPGTIVEGKKAVDGKDIYTSLDSRMQSYLEDVIGENFETYTPEYVSAILMEAKTGEILAASQRPGFNPETKEGLDAEGMWRNLLVEESYEPGSTMKVFTMAAALEEQKVDLGGFFESGSLQVGDRTIYDHIRGGKGIMTYRQGFAWSSNVAMVHLQQALGDKWPEYIKRFGFLKSTNSGLPNEEPGYMQDGDVFSLANTAFGQGIAVNAFQMMQGFTAIANEGKMLKPQYIKKMIDADGKVKYFQPEIVGQPISPYSANQVLELMRDVVEDRTYGTGFATYNIPDYSVSAKTGTAEISRDGQYLTGKNDYIFSVVQIVPTENPEYIMYVALKRPVVPGNKTAGKIVAEISNPVLKRALDLDIANEPKENE